MMKFICGRTDGEGFSLHESENALGDIMIAGRQAGTKLWLVSWIQFSVTTSGLP